MGKAFYSPSEMQAAVNKLREEAAHNDVQPQHLAADHLEIARQNNDLEGMKFWRGVWIKIMSDEFKQSQK